MGKLKETKHWLYSTWFEFKTAKTPRHIFAINIEAATDMASSNIRSLIWPVSPHKGLHKVNVKPFDK